MMNILVLQLHDGLHGPVVVVEVDGSHHLGPFQVSNLHCHLADGVAANELHHLLRGRVARVHFDGGELDVLGRQTKDHCLSEGIPKHQGHSKPQLEMAGIPPTGKDLTTAVTAGVMQSSWSCVRAG